MKKCPQVGRYEQRHMSEIGAGQGRSLNVPQRILCFPPEQSIGRIVVLNEDDIHSSTIPGWGREATQRMEARGTIRLPREQNLAFVHIAGVRADLRPFAAFHAGDLYSLSLAFCSVYDDDLVHLRGLHGLQQLDLTDTLVEGHGLVHLQGMIALRRLWLGYSSLTDAGLAHLHQMMSLAHLDLSGCGVSRDGVDALRKALPRCRIISPMERDGSQT